MQRRILNRPKRDSKVISSCLTGLLLSELPVLSNVVAQVAARHQVNHEVEILRVLECVVHVNQETSRIKLND